MNYEPLIANAYYHIYNCGNNKENIFVEEKNYAYFLKLLQKHVLPVVDILSYCLLKNHFHLLIKTNEDSSSKKISQSFSNLFNAYAKAINKAYNRTGSLFRDRFSRIQITDEMYLKFVIIYINTNAIHHGFVNEVDSYRHSSYRSLISDKKTRLCRKEVLRLFENKENFIAEINSKQNIIKELTLE